MGSGSVVEEGIRFGITAHAGKSWLLGHEVIGMAVSKTVLGPLLRWARSTGGRSLYVESSESGLHAKITSPLAWTVVGLQHRSTHCIHHIHSSGSLQRPIRPRRLSPLPFTSACAHLQIRKHRSRKLHLDPWCPLLALSTLPYHWGSNVSCLGAVSKVGVGSVLAPGVSRSQTLTTS
jgi:hypothetical protein